MAAIGAGGAAAAAAAAPSAALRRRCSAAPMLNSLPPLTTAAAAINGGAGTVADAVGSVCGNDVGIIDTDDDDELVVTGADDDDAEAAVAAPLCGRFEDASIGAATKGCGDVGCDCTAACMAPSSAAAASISWRVEQGLGS
jgi:hypothetical protein